MTDERYRLIQGDCLSVLPTLETGSVDCVVTDPPYGVGLGSGKDKRRGGKHGLGKGGLVAYWDTLENFRSVVIPALGFALSLCKRAAVFSGPHFQEMPRAEALGGVYSSAAVGRHCWGFKNFTPILLYGKAPALNMGAKQTVLRSNVTTKKNGHPCPKPLEWMRWLIELTTLPGETVLDPFMGSGTTGVACLQTGRRFIGIELSEDYCAIARKRLEAAAAETPEVAPCPR